MKLGPAIVTYIPYSDRLHTNLFASGRHHLRVESLLHGAASVLQLCIQALDHAVKSHDGLLEVIDESHEPGKGSDSCQIAGADALYPMGAICCRVFEKRGTADGGGQRPVH